MDGWIERENERRAYLKKYNESGPLPFFSLQDSCNASPNHEIAFHEYGLMRDALNKTGRHIYFSLCGWNAWYAPEGWSLGNSWRIAGDCNGWDSIYNAIRTNEGLAKYARPGGWNDPVG